MRRTPVTLCLDSETDARLRETATRNGVSRSMLARMALEHFLRLPVLILEGPRCETTSEPAPENGDDDAA
jgi:hypothetical protein